MLLGLEYGTWWLLAMGVALVALAAVERRITMRVHKASHAARVEAAKGAPPVSGVCDRQCQQRARRFG